jgi:hypothetical protein
MKISFDDDLMCCVGTREGTVSDETRTGETIARMSEVIAAQTSPVCLVVTGDDLGKRFVCVCARRGCDDYLVFPLNS